MSDAVIAALAVLVRSAIQVAPGHSVTLTEDECEAMRIAALRGKRAHDDLRADRDRLAAEVERLRTERDEFAEEVEHYEEHVAEYLPQYDIAPDGEDVDEANFRERIEYAGDEIVSLRTERDAAIASRDEMKSNWLGAEKEVTRLIGEVDAAREERREAIAQRDSAAAERDECRRGERLEAVVQFIDCHARRLAESSALHGDTWDGMCGDEQTSWCAAVHDVLNSLIVDEDGNVLDGRRAAIAARDSAVNDTAEAIANRLEAFRDEQVEDAPDAWKVPVSGVLTDAIILIRGAWRRQNGGG